MLGYDSKAARYTWTVAIVLALVYLVYLVRSTLFIFVLALLFAHLLSPVVNLIDRFLPNRRTPTRTPALALVYIMLVGAVVVLAIQFGSVAVGQAKALAQSFPPMIRSAVASWQNVHTGMREPGRAEATGHGRIPEQTLRHGFQAAVGQHEHRGGRQQSDLPGYHPGSGLSFFEGRRNPAEGPAGSGG